MPYAADELSARAAGGTELMKQALARHLQTAGQEELLEFFDIYTSRIRNFNPARPSIYWVQDLPYDDETRHFIADKYLFSGVVFVSHWQYQEFHRLYPLNKQNTVVIPNAIDLFDVKVWGKWSQPELGSKNNPIRLIYHTTPHRGLEILFPVFGNVCKRLEERGIYVHLDVFSSFSIYGWDERDEPYRKTIDACKNHPAITYHGAVPHARVREALERAHVFAYPCIWPETSCLALIEAMGSGCVCIHSNLAALPETSGGLTVCYPFNIDRTAHCRVFDGMLYGVLSHVVANLQRGQTPGLARLGMERVKAIYNWSHRIHEWVGFLNRTREAWKA